MAKIIGICTSEKKGTQKSEVESARLIENHGIENDAHAGKWHRQVSLLSYEKIKEFREKGADVKLGAFGENIIIDEYDFRAMPVGTRFKVNDAILELSQIGKECHSHCAIYHAVGDCIMPREGVFTEVIKGGVINVGDEVEVIEPDPNRKFSAAVVTISDKGSKGERVDSSGPKITEALKENNIDVKDEIIIPDEQVIIENQLIRLSDQRQVNLIITTGCTGFAKRDVTPEATINVCDKMANGISEAIRAYSMKYTERAMFSRAVSGIRNTTLIINLPGSPKAVSESLEFLLPNLDHALGILRGTSFECAR